MARKGSVHQGTRLSKVSRAAAVIAVLLIALTVTGILSASEDDEKPTPPPGAQKEVSPYVTIAPTTAELLAAPPSIERYVAAHTLPTDALIVADPASVAQGTFQFLPFALYGLAPEPGQVMLTAGEPDSTNTWVLSWTESPGASGYEIQESGSADFSTAQSTFVDAETTLTVTRLSSPSNVYYYRVRSLIGQHQGPWSNVGRVVGGYYDDFEDPSSGWSLRRSTYVEEVHASYDEGNYELDINDRWDWGIASPGMPAPRVPYAINFDATIVDGANLWSFGAVFGGDWPGATCSAGDENQALYTHEDCFNHFYNTNSIFYGPMKLLFERVDQLEWCLKCGGSPMKRIGDIDPENIKTYKLVDPTGWNSYRIEVREDSIKIFAATLGYVPELQYEYEDTRYVNSPYFGLFASTDEYTNALWRFDYFSVLPLDN